MHPIEAAAPNLLGASDSVGLEPQVPCRVLSHQLPGLGTTDKRAAWPNCALRLPSCPCFPAGAGPTCGTCPSAQWTRPAARCDLAIPIPDTGAGCCEEGPGWASSLLRLCRVAWWRASRNNGGLSIIGMMSERLGLTLLRRRTLTTRYTCGRCPTATTSWVGGGARGQGRRGRQRGLRHWTAQRSATQRSPSLTTGPRLYLSLLEKNAC